LEIIKPSWLKSIAKAKHHLNASQSKPRKTLWDDFSSNLNYYYRLNKARIIALKDFDFYYK